MDQSHNSPLPHSEQQQQHHHQQQQQPSPVSTPSHQLPSESTAQNVLAEARRNLQVLIDSGMSRDLLHQWVDESQSLSLSFANSIQSLACLQQSQPSPTPSAAPQHPPPPPPPRGPPPPPPPSQLPLPAGPVGPNSVVAISRSAVPAPPASTPTLQSTNVKVENFADEMPPSWHAPPVLASNPPSAPTAPEPSPHFVGEVDASLFMPPSAPFSHSHRPRISISSVSSGSSGHASIWSTNSAQSSFSWHSGTTSGRSMAPLPMPPSISGVPVLNGSQVSAAASNANRQNIYWCTSCETSFKRKYDWKRHEDEFHERWRKYPCPEPGCNRSFWGSNSFNQHHKQCHGCKTCPHADKVVKFLRKRKYWACGFCSALHPARERHVEHVARHFEAGLSKSDWMHSRVIYGLLHQPHIHQAWEDAVTSREAEYGGRRPQFSWHPSKTGRAQGFLEKEHVGQLQDLLEFFSGDEAQAQTIVNLAHDLADIVLNPGAIPSPQFAGAVPSMAPPPQFHSHGDSHASLSMMPSQGPHPSMLPSTSPNSQTVFPPSFRTPMFLPSQQFASASMPSPESTSQSPLRSSQSPLAPSSTSPYEHRDLPQAPQSSGPSSADSGMMDFEYSPAPVILEDWDVIASSVHDITPQPHGGNQADWEMMQYFAPRHAA